MRTLGIALALLGALACGSGAPTATVCTQADQGSPCDTPTTAELVDGTWRVTLQVSISNQVEYEENGHVCALTRTRCEVKTCILEGGGASMTAEGAIAFCRGVYDL